MRKWVLKCFVNIKSTQAGETETRESNHAEGGESEGQFGVSMFPGPSASLNCQDSCWLSLAFDSP